MVEVTRRAELFLVLCVVTSHVELHIARFHGVSEFEQTHVRVDAANSMLPSQDYLSEHCAEVVEVIGFLGSVPVDVSHADNHTALALDLEWMEFIPLASPKKCSRTLWIIPRTPNLQMHLVHVRNHI